MNLLDLFILVPIGYFAYRGLMSGFIREFFGIAGIVIAVFVTFRYMGPVSGFAAPFVENTDHATIIAGIVLFIFTLAGIQMVAIWLEKAFELIHLSFINQVAGFLFGAIKSALLVSALLLLLAGIDIPQEKTRTESATYPLVIYLAPAAYNLIANIYPETEDFIRTIEKSLKENNTLRTLPIFDNNEPDT